MTNLKLVSNSIQRLARNGRYFERFESFDDWVFYGDEVEVNRELGYFQNVKNHILRKYQLQDIFISPSALDEIIFYAIKTFQPDEVITKIDHLIVDSGLTQNSVVIFPLHSFGFKYLGLRHLEKASASQLKFVNRDFTIFPQTNSFDKSKEQIVDYLDSIKLPNRRDLDLGLFEHFYKSRALRWFKYNPLMVLHFRFSQQERYDNLRFILQKIDFATNKLYFISALTSTASSQPSGSLFSTKNINNWETFDISHFLTVTTTAKRATLNCLPVYFSSLMVFDNTHMNIDLDLVSMSSTNTRWYSRAIRSIDTLYLGFVNYQLTHAKAYSKFYRISNSLKYFRRAIKSISHEDKIVNLNTAFEILLLDDNERNKRDRMISRMCMVFKRKERKSILCDSLSELIQERNNIIHSGYPAGGNIDYAFLNQVYCRLILKITENIKRIDSTKPLYITEFYNSY